MAIELGLDRLRLTVDGEEPSRRCVIAFLRATHLQTPPRSCPDVDHLCHSRQKVGECSGHRSLDPPSLSALSGRPSFVKGNIDITSLRSWLNDSTATAGDYMLVGFIELRTIEVRSAQRGGRPYLTRQRGAKDSLVAAGQPYLRDGIRQGCVVQLEGWVNWWCGTPLVSQGTSLLGSQHVADAFQPGLRRI
jgi:hypothetical protein